jgi:nucleotide exchange factor SIL1
VLSKGYNVFAIQDGGQCFGLNIEAITYNKYGASSDCLSDGKGGPMANEVYRIVASDSVLAGSGNYENPN